MRAYVLRRVAYIVPLWLALSAFAFALGHFAPGDPARALLRLRLQVPPTETQVTNLRHALGLDQPIAVQYVRSVGNTLHGDLGDSFRTGDSVAHSLWEALPVTLQLTLYAFVLAMVIAVPLGVVAALRRGSWIDHLSRVLALAGASLPSFLLGYVLIIVFAVKLQIFPTSGTDSPASYVLPSVTLSLYVAGVLLRITRASMLEVLSEDFIRAARARGLSRFSVIVRHALRVALNPVITYAGLVGGFLLGGAVIVETVFAMPGMGKLVVDAINDRDFPVVQGFVLYFGTLVLLINLATDLLYVAADPRVRLTGPARVDSRANA